MSHENRGDPWDEIEGIPPHVKKLYRTPLGEERWWGITLSELQGLASWLAYEPVALYESIAVYDDDILAMLAQRPDAVELWSNVCKRLSESSRECLVVEQLFRRLAMKLSNEIREALRQASDSHVEK